jgi:DNA repair protein Rad10
MATSSAIIKSARLRGPSTSRELVRRLSLVVAPLTISLNSHSLRYHLLHPEYIHTRIKALAHSYALRLMIVHCDVDNHQAAMRELTKVCIVNEYTMIVAWR